MFINNIIINDFGAKVEKKYISPSQINVSVEWKKTLLPLLIDKEVSFKEIKVELLFRAATRNEILKNISKFTKEIAECDIKFRNISNSFHCFIISVETKESEFDDWLFLNLEFMGYEYSDEVEVDCSNSFSKSFNVDGNKNTPIILEVTSKIDSIDFIIEGLGENITIKNLKANKKIIINSVDGTILEGNINKFNSVEFWEFPFLVPGYNTIKFSRDDMNVKLKYNPLWL